MTQPIAVDLGVEERAHEVVVPVTGALGEQILEVRVDRVGRCLLVGLGLRMAARLTRDLVRPDDAVLHRDEARQLVEREPEHRQEHLRRERHRELLREVDLVVVHERIDQLVGEGGDAVPRAPPCVAARRADRGSSDTCGGRADPSAAGSTGGDSSNLRAPTRSSTRSRRGCAGCVRRFARELAMTPTPSTRSTGEPASSIWYVGCGSRANADCISSRSMPRPSLWSLMRRHPSRVKTTIWFTIRGRAA